MHNFRKQFRRVIVQVQQKLHNAARIIIVSIVNVFFGSFWRGGMLLFLNSCNVRS